MDEPHIPVPLLDEGEEIAYTPAQLQPTISRLQRALFEDAQIPGWRKQQRLAAAWTRVAELRLPRKAVPKAVLDQIEDLFVMWSIDGIDRYAATLTDDEVEREFSRLRWMLGVCEHAASLNQQDALVSTE